jgi:nitrate/TMAO reductase-like tetraheme cytochrome c subunit
MKILHKLKDYYLKYKTRTITAVTVLIIAFFAFTYYSVELTSTPEFCINCHEIQPAYDTWKESSHYNISGNYQYVKSKEIATCRDCHLPPWSEPVNLIWAKMYHGTKDVYHHIADKEELDKTYYRYLMKVNARKSAENSTCLKCHSDIYDYEDRQIKVYHRSLKDNKASRCIDCHKNLVH